MFESDSLRRIQLRAVGAEHAFVDGQRIEPALFIRDPQQAEFDGLRVDTDLPSLVCIERDVRALSVCPQQRVEVPGESDEFYVARIVPDSGLVIVELGKE